MDKSVASETSGADAGMDMPAHENTYAGFLKFSEIGVLATISFIVSLSLWGIKLAPGWAFIGFLLTLASTATGIATSLGWRAIAPVLVLLFLLLALL